MFRIQFPANNIIRYVGNYSALFWMIGLVIMMSACQSSDTSPTPSPTTPLPNRVIIALQNLANYTSYVQTTNEYLTNQTLLKRDGETVDSLTIETRTTTISRVTIENANMNVAADITSVVRGTEGNNAVTRDLDYGLEAELRLVDGILYLQADHQFDGESLVSSEPPTGWQIIFEDNLPNFDGIDTLGISSWVAFRANDGRLVGRMGEWMITHYTAVESLTSQATEINTQVGTLEDGTPVEVIRFSGEGLASGVSNTIPFVVNSADGVSVLQAGIQYPSVTFTIDEHNRIRSRIISYNVIVENIDATLFVEAEEDTRISILMTVNIVESYANINTTIPPIDAPPTFD